MSDDPDGDATLDAIESAHVIASDPEAYPGERAARLARHAAKAAADGSPMVAAALTLRAAGVEPTAAAVAYAARDLPPTSDPEAEQPPTPGV